jgi:hypothetical protein
LKSKNGSISTVKRAGKWVLIIIVSAALGVFVCKFGHNGLIDNALAGLATTIVGIAVGVVTQYFRKVTDSTVE